MGILSLATKATSPTATLYLAGAILALVVSLYLVIAVQSARVSKRDATIANLHASIAETTANATQAARVAEQVAARSLAEAVETNRKANENAQAEFDAALADSAVRLRKRFACQARSPDLPSDAAAAFVAHVAESRLPFTYTRTRHRRPRRSKLAITPPVWANLGQTA